MFASNLISYAVPPLMKKDSGEKALNWMSDFHVRHLPVVEDGQFLGILSEDEVLNFIHPELSLEENQPLLIQRYVHPTQHLFDVMKLIIDTDLTIVPVLDEVGKYLGLITLESTVKHFAETTAITHPGGVLVLDMAPRDYSLAEIARIIESEAAKILSCYISSPYGTERLEVTIKLNKQDLKHIVATLERFDYQIKTSFFESDYLDSLKERYEGLMRYLNV